MTQYEQLQRVKANFGRMGICSLILSALYVIETRAGYNGLSKEWQGFIGLLIAAVCSLFVGLWAATLMVGWKMKFIMEQRQAVNVYSQKRGYINSTLALSIHFLVAFLYGSATTTGVLLLSDSMRHMLWYIWVGLLLAEMSLWIYFGSKQADR